MGEIDCAPSAGKHKSEKLPPIPRRKIPEEWKHLERAITRNGNPARYFLHCQRCYAPKGHTSRPFCIRCRRREPRVVGVQVNCTHCDKPIGRNALIRGLYFAGAASTDLGKVFDMSANQILNIAKQSPDKDVDV